MTQDNITSLAVVLSVSDMATRWTDYLPEPTLQNLMYIVTIGWIIYQAYRKATGKEK